MQKKEGEEEEEEEEEEGNVSLDLKLKIEFSQLSTKDKLVRLLQFSVWPSAARLPLSCIKNSALVAH